MFLGTFSSVLTAHSAETLRLGLGMAESVLVKGASAGNFTSIIGDPKIADVTFGPRNTLWFIGLAEGTTNVIMLDRSR
jgi:Flp pilus assembly secretin CpaC